MSDDVTLTSGQTARLEAGVVRVVQPPVTRETPCYYKMTAQHSEGALLDVRCADIDSLMAFRAQLEALGYTMRNVVRQS